MVRLCEQLTQRERNNKGINLIDLNPLMKIIIQVQCPSTTTQCPQASGPLAARSLLVVNVVVVVVVVVVVQIKVWTPRGGGGCSELATDHT